MRKWKISLCGVNANGEDEPMPYVDHVEYILHHTFEPPVRSKSLLFHIICFVLFAFGDTRDDLNQL